MVSGPGGQTVAAGVGEDIPATRVRINHMQACAGSNDKGQAQPESPSCDRALSTINPTTPTDRHSCLALRAIADATPGPEQMA